MTSTRAWDFSGEISDLEVMGNIGSGSERSQTQAHTGSWSWRTGAQTDATVMGVPQGSTFLRAGLWIWVTSGGINGVDGDINILGFHQQFDTALGVKVAWMEDEERLDLIIDGSIEDTIALSAMSDWVTDTWYHIGLIASVSDQFASFYVNGVQVMTYSGVITEQPWDAVYITAPRQTFAFDSFAYLDDGYVDVLSGESDAAPPMYGFLPSYVLAAGEDAEFTPLSGDNYQMVDEGATPDDDTTYNKTATSAGSLKDTFSCDDVAIPEDYIIVAAHPFVVVRKLNAADDAQIKNIAWDGLTQADGSAQAVPIAYGVKKSRMTAQPDTESWNEDDFNAMEFGYEAAGSF